jgi:arabinofuranosyltransferase
LGARTLWIAKHVKDEIMGNILHLSKKMFNHTNKLAYWPYFFIVFVLFPIAVAFSRWIYAPCDDAYIFLVYARNFVEGNGLTYNGILVEGYSSITWVITLAILGLTHISLPFLAESLSLLSGLLALVTTYVLAKNLNFETEWMATLPVVLLVATGDFAFYMSNGLEEILFTAIMTLCIALSYSQLPENLLKSFYFPLLMAFMILTRPEGALISALLLLLLATKGKSLWRAVQCGLILILLLTPILISRRLVYGYWLPNTWYVKGNAGLSNFYQGITYLLHSVWRYASILVSFAGVLLYMLYKKQFRTLEKIWPLGLIGAVWIFYVLIQGGDNMVGGRLLIPILPLAYVVLVKSMAEIWPRSGTVFIFIILISVFLITGYLTDQKVASHANAWRQDFALRKKAGIYLSNNFSDNTVIALNPAGIIPFYSKLRTIDMLGLNDTHIAHAGKRDYTLRYGHQAGDGTYILSRKPNIILFGTASINPAHYISDQEIWESPQFRKEYALVEWPGIGFAYIRISGK